MHLELFNDGVKMKVFLLITFSLLLWVTGCQKGACYYSCCKDENTCTPKCEIKTDSAEQCAVFAQETCEQSGATDVARVEWKEISDIYCDECSSIACAPSWWTEDRLIEEKMPDSGSEIDTYSHGKFN